MRDARITTIYEGTTGIQANDLIGRKIAREGGATLKAVIAAMRQTRTDAMADGELVALAATFGVAHRCARGRRPNTLLPVTTATFVSSPSAPCLSFG